MQKPGSRFSVAGLIGTMGVAGLVTMACAAQRPEAASTPAPIRDSDPHLQPAVSRYYGQLPPAQTGEHRLVWFVFRNDWSVERHAIGMEDAVEVVETTTYPGGGGDDKSRRALSVNASLSKKWPDLGKVGENSPRLTGFGGGSALIGKDTVSVFWARYAR